MTGAHRSSSNHVPAATPYSLAAFGLLLAAGMLTPVMGEDAPRSEGAPSRILKLPARIPSFFRRDTDAATKDSAAASNADSKISRTPSTHQSATQKATETNAASKAEPNRMIQRAQALLIDARLMESRGDLAGALEQAERAEQIHQAAVRTVGAKWPAKEPTPRDYLEKLEQRMASQSLARQGATIANAKQNAAIQNAAESRNTAVQAGSQLATSGRATLQAAQQEANEAAGAFEDTVDPAGALPAFESAAEQARQTATHEASETIQSARAALLPSDAGSLANAAQVAGSQSPAAEFAPIRSASGKPLSVGELFAPVGNRTSIASDAGNSAVARSNQTTESSQASNSSNSPAVSGGSLGEQFASIAAKRVASEVNQATANKPANDAVSAVANGFGVFSAVKEQAANAGGSAAETSLSMKQALNTSSAIAQAVAPIAQAAIPDSASDKLKKVSSQGQAILETARTIEQSGRDLGIIHAGGKPAEGGSEHSTASSRPEARAENDITGTLLDGLHKLDSMIPGTQTAATPAQPQEKSSTSAPLAIPDLLENHNRIDDQRVSPIPTEFANRQSSGAGRGIDVDKNEAANTVDTSDAEGDALVSHGGAPLLLSPASEIGSESSEATGPGIIGMFLLQVGAAFTGVMLAAGTILLIRRRLKRMEAATKPATQPSASISHAKQHDDSADVVPFPRAAEKRSEAA